MRERFLRALFVGALVMLPARLHAASTFLLAIDGVQGESTVDGHVNEIDVRSFGWSVGPNGARRPVTCPTALTISKRFDAASPALALAALTKQRFATARLLGRTTGNEPVDFVTIALANAGVSRYQTGGAAADDALLETIELSFSDVTVTYTPHAPNGTALPPRSFTYETTKPCTLD